jgi:exopolysaccharide biosynthesis predicted pyruvyltransferase EpsI
MNSVTNKDDTVVETTTADATSMQDVSMQLRQIQEFQTRILQQKEDELAQLHSLISSQQNQLQVQQQEIHQIQIDRLREHDERALELQQLVRSNDNAGDSGGGGGYRNPYSSDDFMDCSELLNICSVGGGNDDSPSSLRRRRGRAGGRRGQSSSPSSYCKMDILHRCFLALFVLLQLRYLIASSQSIQVPSDSNMIASYNNDYTTPEPKKLHPWESKPPTPISMNSMFSSSTALDPHVRQRHSCIQGIRERHEKDLGTFLFGSSDDGSNSVEWRTLLVDPAYHTNVGDHMLTLGELAFFKKHANARTEQCHHMQSEHFFPPCDDVMTQRTSSSSQLALWHAGGNWGDLWWDVHGLRIKSFERYLRHDFKIVSMPQSLFYQDEGLQERDAVRIKESIALGLGLAEEPDAGLQQQQYGQRRRLDDFSTDDWMAFQPEPVKPVDTSKLDTYAGVQLAKSRVTFTWREQESYDKAVQLYPYVNHMIVPNIAFQLGPFQPIREHPEKLVDIMFLLRGDHESIVQTYRDENYIRTLLPGKTFRIADWPDRLQIFGTRDTFFTDTSIELLSLGKIVICDRLHAAILCYLTGLPFVYIDQISGKISNTFRVAFEQMEDCANGEATSLWAKATSMEEAVAKAIELVERHQLDHKSGTGGGLRKFFGY